VLRLEQAKGLRLGKLALGKLHIWDTATWENILGKLSLGKMPLENYQASICMHDLIKNNINLQ